MNGLSRLLKVTLKVCIPAFAAVARFLPRVNEIYSGKCYEHDNGITRLTDRLFHIFAMPADTWMPLIYKREFLMMKTDVSCTLQGLVNKTHPRLFLFQPAGEGKVQVA